MLRAVSLAAKEDSPEGLAQTLPRALGARGPPPTSRTAARCAPRGAPAPLGPLGGLPQATGSAGGYLTRGQSRLQRVARDSPAPAACSTGARAGHWRRMQRGVDAEGSSGSRARQLVPRAAASHQRPPAVTGCGPTPKKSFRHAFPLPAETRSSRVSGAVPSSGPLPRNTWPRESPATGGQAPRHQRCLRSLGSGRAVPDDPGRFGRAPRLLRREPLDQPW